MMLRRAPFALSLALILGASSASAFSFAPPSAWRGRASLAGQGSCTVSPARVLVQSNAGRMGTARLGLRMAAVTEKGTKDLRVDPDMDPIVSGDTGGAMLVMEDVTISRGGRDLMSQVNWKLLPGDRIGLVGPNGAGKSTLLSAAAQRIPVMGKNIMAPNMRMGYLIQSAVAGSERTAWQEASSQMIKLNKARDELEVSTAEITGGDTSERALNRMADAQTAFENAGGYNVEEKVASVLSGLGFGKDDFTKLCSDFSGGWQMKIALARLLLSEPDMLLLDEPTNHLDAAAKAWLGGYVAGYDGTVVLVTHEESLLTRAALTGIVEVRDERALVFRGSYDKFLIEREQRVLRAQTEWEQQQREIASLEDYITRFGAKASHAASAQSKQKMLDRIVRVPEPKNLEKPSARPNLRFPPPQFLEEEVLSLKKATWGWNEQPLYSDVNIDIVRGMRLAILGPNGCGKSTLLAALTGRLPLLSGERKLAESMEMGIFTQDLAQELDLNQVAMDYVSKTVQDKDPSINLERVRAVMGALGLTGSKATQRIGTMSGGEKARVALSMFVLIPHNCLILDEPSNHLDVGTVEVLTEALQEYKGTVVVVTHNREFLELLAPTHIASVGGAPGSQKVTVEERPLRPSDWEGLPEEEGGGVPGARKATITLGRSGGGAGVKKMGGGRQATAKPAKDEEPAEREKYAWEADDALDTGMSINAKGQLVSKDNKKMTPQQKKKEKQQGKGGMFSSTTLDRSEESGDGKKAVMYRKGDKKPKSNKQGKK
mmetsp:Transcript_46102/g.108785  ORF Transcript_46102/g.108785 Transcript_46102/m.108785 type:complete len:772 (+) Transcript_46102:38-2353(+)